MMSIQKSNCVYFYDDKRIEERLCKVLHSNASGMHVVQRDNKVK